MPLTLDSLEIDLKRQKYYVKIEGNSFASTNFNTLPELIAEASTITRVKITGYSSDPTSFTSVVKLIAPRSIAVDVSGNTLGSSAIEIAKILASSKTVTKVDLSNDALLKYGSTVLAEFASSQIVDIIMADNWMSLFDSSVFDGFKTSSFLHRIDLSHNDLDSSLTGVNSEVLVVTV